METRLLHLPDGPLCQILDQDPYVWKASRQTCRRLHGLVARCMRQQQCACRPLTRTIRPIHFMPGLGKGFDRPWTHRKYTSSTFLGDGLCFGIDHQGELWMGGANRHGGGYITRLRTDTRFNFRTPVIALRYWGSSGLALAVNSRAMITWRGKRVACEHHQGRAIISSNASSTGWTAVINPPYQEIGLYNGGELRVLPNPEGYLFDAVEMGREGAIVLARHDNKRVLLIYDAEEVPSELVIPVEARPCEVIQSDGSYVCLKRADHTGSCLINIETAELDLLEASAKVFLQNGYLFAAEENGSVWAKDLIKEEVFVLQEEGPDRPINRVAFDGWKVALYHTEKTHVYVYDIRTRECVYGVELISSITGLKMEDNALYVGLKKGAHYRIGLEPGKVVHYPTLPSVSRMKRQRGAASSGD